MMNVAHGRHVKRRYKHTIGEIAPLLLIIFFILLFPKYFSLALAGVAISPFNIAMLLATIGGIFSVLTDPQKARAIARIMKDDHAFVLFLFFFVSWGYVCSVAGRAPLPSIVATMRFDLAFFFPYVAVLIYLSTPPSRRTFRKLFLCASLVAGMLGVLEKMVGQSIVSMLNLAALSADPITAGRLGAGAMRDGVFRAVSTFMHPINLGQYMAAIMPLAALGALRFRGTERLLCGALLIVAPAAAMASGSRSVAFVAAVSFYVCAIFFMRVRVSTRVSLLVFVSLVFILVYFVFYDVLSSLITGRSDEEYSSTLARAVMFDAGMSALASSPLFGYGSGMSILIAGVGHGDAMSIDNFYLSIVLDYGVPGFVSLVAAFAIIFSKLSPASQYSAGSEDRVFMLGLLSMSVGLSVGLLIISIYENLVFIFVSMAYCQAALMRAERLTASVRSRHGTSKQRRHPKYSNAKHEDSCPGRLQWP